MANTVGMIGVSSSPSLMQYKNLKTRTTENKSKMRILTVSVSATVTSDPYRMLRIKPDASKSDVKKAFRKLALQYHPDVCKGNNNGIQFHHINEAYDIVMTQLREESRKSESRELVMETYEPYDEVSSHEAEMGVCDPDLDLWEEWMGWEGAGIRDYSSHINPYL